MSKSYDEFDEVRVEDDDELQHEDLVLSIMGYSMGDDLDPEDLFPHTPTPVGQDDGSSWPDYIKED